MILSAETFLLILVFIAGFYMAWNIGANDVANAMGTSVGSGALTLRQAIMVAALLEFLGAFLFGGNVSQTIQTGLIDASIFSDKPYYFVYGMLSSLIAAGIWLQIASYYGWPVSTTHSIVGAVIGFGVVLGGAEAIYWENFSVIVISWIISPVFGGIVSYGIFMYLRKKIFYAPRPLEAAKKLTPYLAFSILFVLTMIVFYKGGHNIESKFNLAQTSLISLTAGVVGYAISKRAIGKMKNLTAAASKNHLTGFADVKSEFQGIERIFGFLQIISACLMAFAHGANDVANAIGPFSAAVVVLTTGALPIHTAIPAWTLALGGLGIIIGLATWGWRVIETIGKKITELTPTRGFSAEFGAALTILIASRIGLPISSTQTLVGSVIGVGLARGIEALDLSTTRDIFISWLVTVPAGALIAVGVCYLLIAI